MATVWYDTTARNPPSSKRARLRKMPAMALARVYRPCTLIRVRSDRERRDTRGSWPLQTIS
jgi:hypothetical protein